MNMGVMVKGEVLMQNRAEGERIAQLSGEKSKKPGALQHWFLFFLIIYPIGVKKYACTILLIYSARCKTA